MVLYSNGLIMLEYDPATDILSVALPDIRRFGVSDVERSLEIVVEHIINYDIKKLFLDSSKAIIEVGDDEYRQVISKFSMALVATRLQQLARVGSQISAQEKRAAKVADELRKQNNTGMDFRNFTSKEAALEWLKSVR